MKRWWTPGGTRSAGSSSAEVTHGTTRDHAPGADTSNPSGAEAQAHQKSRPGKLGPARPGDVQRNGPSARDLQGVGSLDCRGPQAIGAPEPADEGHEVPVRHVDAESLHQSL